MTVSGPDGPARPFERTLLDRIGFDVRRIGGRPNLNTVPAGQPALSDLDVFTLHATSSLQSPTAAAALGNTDLSNRLNDLSTALTNLVQTPANPAFKSQALAGLDSITTLLRVDPTLASFADPLVAATPTQVQTAVVAIGHVLDGFAETVTALRHHNVEVYLIPNRLAAQPGVPQQVGVLLRNLGDQTTTYDRTVGTGATFLRVRGNLLVAAQSTGSNLSNTRIDTYSLADPSNPQPLGSTGNLPLGAVTSLLVTDTHVFAVLVNVWFFVPNTIFAQTGGVLAVNIQNPAAPFVDGDVVSAAGTPAGRDGANDGLLFNDYGTTTDGIGAGGQDLAGGRSNTWDVAQVSPTLLLVTGSTSTGGATQAGSRVVHVVDVSDPRNMRVVRSLQLPGTVQGYGVTVAGDRAYLTASEGGFQSAAGLPFAGHVVLAALDLTVAGLPAGVTAGFAQPQVSVPPGVGNFREVTLTLTAGAGVAPGAIPFTVTAAATTTATVSGTLTVAAQGVGVRLDRTAGLPGKTFSVTVTNTGTVPDTFDLAAAGPAGLFATLAAPSVTLVPGQSQVVSLTTGAAGFAVPGGLGLMVVATSRAAPAVRASAAGQLMVPATVGLTAAFTPAATVIPVPGATDLVLNVGNTGNTQDAYSATITRTTGPLSAAIVGLDGILTQAIPTFRLTGLSTGAIVLRTTLAAAGTGTVTVTDRSLSDPTRVVTVTATVGTSATQPLVPTATPQAITADGGTLVTITLGGTDPNSPAQALTFTIVSPPSHGTLGAIVGNTVTYTPAAGYVGPDEFTFAATNGAAISVTVRLPRPVLLGYHEFGVGAGAGSAAVARFFNPDGTERFARDVFPGLTGGVRVTSADFNGDGVADLVAGTGPGSITRDGVLDGTTGAELFSIQPFEDRFVGGVFVAAGDVTRDGVPDLIITPDESGGPRVRVFTGAGFGSIADFYGIDDPDFRGGARAAVGDVNGDGFADLVASAGFGGGPRISVIDGQSITASQPRTLFGDFFLFEEALRNGAYVAAGDIDGDGFADVIGGGGPGGGPRVLALSGQDLLHLPPSDAGVVANFFGGNADNRGGIRVVARDLDGDRRADLVVGDGTGAGSRVTGYLGKTVVPGATPPRQFALDAFPGFAGGVFVG